MTDEAREVGRPSSFSAETADKICERIADGRSLRSICEDDEFPDKATVYRWLAAHEEFRDQYALARELQADTLFDDILEISDDARNDWMERRGEDDAGWAANGEHIQRSRLRVDARKWMAGKLRPKKYGDKLELGGRLTISHEDALGELE
ncbi:terminase small subunit-like protein [Mesorhizobium sp. A556]